MSNPAKILLAADLHSQREAFQNLTVLINEHRPGWVIFTGDVVNNDRNDIDLLEKLDQDLKIPWYAIPGNNESTRAIEWLNNHDHDLDLKEREISGERFFGIGGWGELENLPAGMDLAKIIPGCILVTHVPPTLSRQPLARGPKIHIFGHQHGFFQINKVGDTTQVQLKALTLGSAALLELPSLKITEITVP